MESLWQHCPGLREIGNSALVGRLRTEIQQLGTTEVGLGEFDEEVRVQDINLEGLGTRILNTAPELCGLLSALMAPSYTLSKPTHKTPTGPIIMISSILAYASSVKKRNNLPTFIGIFLHAHGVKRRVLDLFTGLGIIPSYLTIQRRRSSLVEIGKVTPLSCMLLASQISVTFKSLADFCTQRDLREIGQSARLQSIICWDNFDYNQNVRHQTLREPSEHISATTGKLCLGISIPPAGLSNSMFDQTIHLDPNDIFLAPGNQYGDIYRQSQLYWVAEAIRYCHPDAIEYLFPNGKGWPEFPMIKCLPPQVTSHHSLGPILENEGTIDGTYNVIDNIFKEQLGFSEIDDFSNQLQLVYGDQKDQPYLMMSMVGYWPFLAYFTGAPTSLI